MICAVALVARLAYFIVVHYSEPQHLKPFAYGGETGSIAASLASGHGFSSPLGQQSGPTAWITPVFPLLLASVFKLFGVFSVKSYYIIRLLDVLFSAATTYPIFLIARRHFGIAAASLGAWLWAFLPAAIYFPVVWVWDMSFTALLLAVALWLTFEIPQRDSLIWWVLYGALWGFTVLVNAAVLSVLVACAPYAIYRSFQLRRRWPAQGAAALLAFALTLAPWIIRNQIVFHGQVTLRSNFGLELWLGNNPEVPDSWSWWLHPTGSRTENAEFYRLGEVAYMQQKRHQAWNFMKTHPTDVARFEFHRFLQTWTGETDSFRDIWATGSLRLRAEILWNYSLTLLMLLGLLFAYRLSPRASFPLLCAIVLFPIPYYICHTDPRYRHPIDPVIVVLAGYASARFLERLGIFEDRALRNAAPAPASRA